MPVGNIKHFETTAPRLARYYDVTSANTSQFSFVVSLSATSEIISEIKRIGETDPPEDRPAQSVCDAAVNIINSSNQHSLIFLPAAETESFEGSLLVHWELRDRRVTLIAAPDGRMKLYKNGNSNLSELIPNPSAVELSSALHSLMQ